MPIETTNEDKDSWDALAKRVLELDECVMKVVVSDTTGQMITFAIRDDLSQYLKELLTKETNEFSFAPALIASIVGQGERYFGKPEYIVGSYPKVKVLLIPFRSKGVSISTMVTPYTDGRSLIFKIREILAE